MDFNLIFINLINKKTVKYTINFFLKRKMNKLSKKFNKYVETNKIVVDKFLQDSENILKLDNTFSVNSLFTYDELKKKKKVFKFILKNKKKKIDKNSLKRKYFSYLIWFKLNYASFYIHKYRPPFKALNLTNTTKRSLVSIQNYDKFAYIIYENSKVYTSRSKIELIHILTTILNTCSYFIITNFFNNSLFFVKNFFFFVRSNNLNFFKIRYMFTRKAKFFSLFENMKVYKNRQLLYFSGKKVKNFQKKKKFYLSKQNLNYFVKNKKVSNKFLNFFFIRSEFFKTKKYFFNKVHCFWPLTLNFIKFFLKKFNKIKKKRVENVKSRKSLNILKKNMCTSYNSLTYKTHKILYNNYILKHAYSKKFKNRNKKNFKLHKMNKSLIKILWTSTKFFKKFVISKRRWTIKKYKKFMFNFLKKNKLEHYSNYKEFMWLLLVRLNIILSKKEFFFFNKFFFFRKNGEIIDKVEDSILIGDIISFPLLLLTFRYKRLRKKNKTLKKVKAWMFKRFTNINSQWRDVRKKIPEGIEYLLNNLSFIPKFIEIDYFSSNLVKLRNSTKNSKIALLTNRHNLEKLNTWRMRI